MTVLEARQEPQPMTDRDRIDTAKNRCAIVFESMRNIVGELRGTGLLELGLSFGAGNDRDIQKNQMYYQRAILEQNFIIIRQLDRISKLLSDR